MTRSPLFYPLNRGGDTDAGGTADLQTDVMRFMAILSLCLVAIFALVQSIPLTPTTDEPSRIDVAPDNPQTEFAPRKEAVPVEPAVKPITAADLTRPVPRRVTTAKEHVALQRPKPAPVRQADPTPADETHQSPLAEGEQGFTLRFETDAALTWLVSRQVVGLYAMTPEKSLRMNIEDDEISFWPASVPGRFHEMDQSTVPDEVLAAYRRGNRTTGIKWGVTLPADISRKLNNYLSSASGGSLIIAGNGEIDLRR